MILKTTRVFGITYRQLETGRSYVMVFDVYDEEVRRAADVNEMVLGYFETEARRKGHWPVEVTGIEQLR